jgi:hypothetical protein
MPVTVKTDRPIVLYELGLIGTAEREVLSTAPGAAEIVSWLPKYGRLRVGGPGVAGAEFQLPFAESARVDISVGCRGCSTAGSALLATGGIVAGAGLWVLVGGLITSTGAADSAVGPPGYLPVSKQLYISGGVLLSGGLLALLAGAISYSLGKTSVEISPSGEPTALRLPGGLRLAARGLLF